MVLISTVCSSLITIEACAKFLKPHGVAAVDVQTRKECYNRIKRSNMLNVTIYTTRICPFCYHAKKLLDSKGVPFEEIDVNMSPGARQEMMQRANGGRTLPQIFFDETHVGGCDELYDLEQQARLDFLLNPQG